MHTYNFVLESNKIEGILRPPTDKEVQAHDRLVHLSSVTIDDLEEFVEICQPGAVLRIQHGMDVRVGWHTPPPGGQTILFALEDLLTKIDDMTPYDAHVVYETLHPFTDGNGRSGRALWAWHMLQVQGDYPLGFLHHFYYQSLEAAR